MKVGDLVYVKGLHRKLLGIITGTIADPPPEWYLVQLVKDHESFPYDPYQLEVINEVG
tara:strand:+ start:301 stop:474 length:174 start_codon:yes stop_codon:yes gene_type:complete